MKKIIYFSYFILLSFLLVNCISKSNNAEQFTSLAEEGAKRMVAFQSGDYLSMEGFNVIKSETIYRPAQKIFNKKLPEARDHKFVFKTILKANEDCEKCVTHFKGQEKNIFYTLECRGFDNFTMGCDGLERFFKGDEFEVTCTITYMELAAGEKFTNVKVEPQQYKRVKDGSERSTFKGETYRKTDMFDMFK